MTANATAKSHFYSPDNLLAILPFLHPDVPPAWLLLGGPADAREAQTARELWPEIKIVGVEPNPKAVHFQRNHGWPADAPLVLAALSDRDGLVAMRNAGSDLRHASAYPSGTKRIPEDAPAALAVTWDSLDKRYGPFTNAILWMDIEGSELEAIRGATKILERDGSIMLINVELMNQTSEPESWGRIVEVDRLIESYGFKAVRDWNDSDWCRDRVYVRVKG